ncbi:uncharacterized protein FOMMEDRAFT_152659 [Fomitiporia mediterranea MF3/22]|uniref:uncharacterized protein n=1 Tax=Fomitiporia mediterranea (strain MF3/22) TaxID=694068 RepID=UPI0004408FEC|nr:uncharacterized protein FOMMEDRAFT_152659 [Fomitiporia mediterranea MF3/22]EJD05361.1 hypothetical protein FOMMEDRAFT_152659 [Fomitiporia mediterranea MF3/22]
MLPGLIIRSFVFCSLARVGELTTPLVGDILERAGCPTLLCVLGGHLLINLKEAAELGVNEGTNYRAHSIKVITSELGSLKVAGPSYGSGSDAVVRVAVFLRNPRRAAKSIGPIYSTYALRTGQGTSGADVREQGFRDRGDQYHPMDQSDA